MVRSRCRSRREGKISAILASGGGAVDGLHRRDRRGCDSFSGACVLINEPRGVSPREGRHPLSSVAEDRLAPAHRLTPAARWNRSTAARPGKVVTPRPSAMRPGDDAALQGRRARTLDLWGGSPRWWGDWARFAAGDGPRAVALLPGP